jgi:hypothetical protein
MATQKIKDPVFTPQPRQPLKLLVRTLLKSPQFLKDWLATGSIATWNCFETRTQSYDFNLQRQRCKNLQLN